MDQAIEILLVEDNASDAKLTMRALQKNNLCNNITHLTDGAEALDFLFAKGKYSERNAANKPKVIMLDLKMPKISGIEVLKALKSDEKTQSIPIIVMTSSREDSDINTCYKMGVNSYVVKPVGFESFSKAVTDLGMYWMLINQEPKI